MTFYQYHHKHFGRQNWMTLTRVVFPAFCFVIRKHILNEHNLEFRKQIILDKLETVCNPEPRGQVKQHFWDGCSSSTCNFEKNSKSLLKTATVCGFCLG